MSPIKNVSNQVRMPRLGKLRLGIKVEKLNDKGEVISSYPKAVDYFVCTPEVQAIFGEKPTELTIVFPTNNCEKIASQWLKYYSKTRGLICKGDGETAMALCDIKTGEIATKDSPNVELREVRCDPDKCQFYASKHCKEMMSLQFLLPDVPGLGIWQLDTGSYYSILNVNSCLSLVKSLFGRIAGIPLTLALIEQQVQPDGKKKTVKVLQIRSDMKMADLAKSQYLMIGQGNDKAIPAPVELLPGEVAEPEDYQNEEEPETKPEPKVTTTPAEAQEIKENGLFADGDCTPPTSKPAPAPANVIRKIEEGQINALIVLSGATDEADLKVRFERQVGRSLKSLSDVTFKEAGAWIEELQPSKKGKKS